jgi:hypothetical protein
MCTTKREKRAPMPDLSKAYTMLLSLGGTTSENTGLLQHGAGLQKGRSVKNTFIIYSRDFN